MSRYHCKKERILQARFPRIKAHGFGILNFAVIALNEIIFLEHNL